MDQIRIFSSLTRGQYRYLWLFILLLWPNVTFGQVFNVTPSIAVGERYDDNISQSNNNRREDFITEVTPGIELLYQPSEEMRLNFDYRPTLNFFKNNSDENSVTQRLRFGLAAPLSRIFSVTMNNTLTITEDPQDRDEDDDELRDRSRERRRRTIRNRGDVGLRVQLAPRIDLGLLFDSLYEDVTDVDENDEFRYGFETEVGYLTSIARGNRASIGYNLTFFTFSSNSSASPDDDDFRIHTIRSRYRHNFTSTLTGNVSFGYSVSESSDSDIDGNQGYVGGVGLTKTLNTGSASVSYDRRFTSGRGDGDLVTTDRFVARLSTNVSSKVTITLGGNVALVDFEKENDNDRKVYVARPSVVYRMLRFWILSTDYSFAFTDYDQSTRADRTNQRVQFVSRFILRQGLSLALTYRYRERTFDDGTRESRQDDEFTRNQLSLTLAYSPTFRLR